MRATQKIASHRHQAILNWSTIQRTPFVSQAASLAAIFFFNEPTVPTRWHRLVNECVIEIARSVALSSRDTCNAISHRAP
jgi:hypothetical protein